MPDREQSEVLGTEPDCDGVLIAGAATRGLVQQGLPPPSRRRLDTMPPWMGLFQRTTSLGARGWT
jgi:hypothetical protein